MTLAAGTGAWLPDPAAEGPFDLTVWPTAVRATRANAEIVRVTARAGDVLTLDGTPGRAKYGSTSRAILLGDQVVLGVTVKTITDIENAILSAPTRSAGYADIGPPTTFPDSTYGYFEVSKSGVVNEAALTTVAATKTVKEVFVYVSAHEVATGGPASASDSENDTGSDAANSPLSWNSTNQIANIWLKHLGTTITDSFGNNLPDLSNREYQWRSLMALRGMGWRYGVKIFRFDTVNDHVSDLGGIGYLPDGVASENDWENRYVLPYLRFVCGGLRAAGFKVGALNGGSKNGYHKDGSQDRGDSRLRWMSRLNPYVDYHGHEYPFQGSDNDPMDDSIHVTHAATISNGYKSWWTYHLRAPALAWSRGKGYIQYVHGSVQALRYAKASALLMWNGRDPFIVCDFDRVGTADATWKYDTGRTLKGGAGAHIWTPGSYAHERELENGKVKLNAQYSGSLTITGTVVPARDAVWVPN